MNRFLFVFILFLGIQSLVEAQVSDLSPQVLGAAGGSGQLGGRYYAYTVGEAFITTLTGNERTITQGFHQPNLYLPVLTRDPLLDDWSIKAFPNPAFDLLNVSFDASQGGALEARVFNSFGQCLTDVLPLLDPAGSVLDCTGLDAGVYLLEVRTADQKASAFLRFVKL